MISKSSTAILVVRAAASPINTEISKIIIAISELISEIEELLSAISGKSNDIKSSFKIMY